MIITRRAATPEDEPFLRAMILASIAQELMAWTWPDAIRDPLLETQYRGKLGSLRANHPEASSEIILADGQPVGWIYLDESPEQVHLCEIMVLIEARGKGIGTIVLREMLSAADHAGKPVRLLVNNTNLGAIQLYERLGFARTGGDEVQQAMERCAQER